LYFKAEPLNFLSYASLRRSNNAEPEVNRLLKLVEELDGMRVKQIADEPKISRGAGAVRQV
jgi:hypothetical protein